MREQPPAHIQASLESGPMPSALPLLQSPIGDLRAGQAVMQTYTETVELPTVDSRKHQHFAPLQEHPDIPSQITSFLCQRDKSHTHDLSTKGSSRQRASAGLHLAFLQRPEAALIGA